MKIRVRWKVAVVLVLFVVTGISYYKSHLPQIVPSSTSSRKLMYNDESLKNLEEQIDRMYALIRTNDKVHSETVDRLRVQISDYKSKLEMQFGLMKDLERRNRQLIDKMSGLKFGTRKREDNYRLAPQVKPDMLRTLNIHQKSEFEVIPFTAFSKDRQYSLEMGMMNKPEVPPIGNKKEEHEKVIEESLQILNKEDRGRPYTKWDLVMGYYRTDRIIGTQYELYYRSKYTENVFEHVQIFRPFAPLQKVQVQSYDKRNEWINLIVPLSGRLETFEQFMIKFTEQCIERDGRVFLTVVYFGEEGKEKAKEILTNTTKEQHFESYKFIEKKENFSRGIGLLTGAEAWIDGDALLFFCDVDVFFLTGFLDRCRLNSAQVVKCTIL